MVRDYYRAPFRTLVDKRFITVNLTETMYALAMITKAGVPARQIAVGVASYGRSFQMVDPSCTGPECFFTGPKSGATPGTCTQTAGIISNAELNQIIANTSIDSTQIFDAGSQSNILVWGSNWAGYMTDEVKDSRKILYTSMNLGGTSDWAVDLQEFISDFDPSEKLSVDMNATSTDWRSISCNLFDPSLDPMTAWNEAFADFAWNDFLQFWTSNDFFAQGANFSEEMAFFFNASTGFDGFDCGTLNDNANCVSVVCKSDVSFAGQLILNSVVNIFDVSRSQCGRWHVSNYAQSIDK
jgi:hypothetical protein